MPVIHFCKLIFDKNEEKRESSSVRQGGPFQAVETPGCVFVSEHGGTVEKFRCTLVVGAVEPLAEQIHRSKAVGAFGMFLSRRFGLSAICRVSVSTAGLKTNSS